MTPILFPLIKADAACKTALGTSPVRFFEFGHADQNTIEPYAVWQLIGGSPENYLDCVPDVDSFTVQIDIYGKDSSTTLKAAKAVSDVLEKVAHITSWRGQMRDPNDKSFRISFDVTLFQKR